MKISLRIPLIGFLLLISIVCGTQSVKGQTKPATGATLFALEVQNLLEIVPVGADILSPLAAISKQNDPAQASSEAIRNLVDALLAGAQPSVLFDYETENHHVGVVVESLPAQKLKYGSPELHIRLIHHLWSIASATYKVDPDQAARYARAAALLCAHDEFPLGRTQFIGLTDEKNRFAEVAGLSEKQTKALVALREEQVSANSALYSRTYIAALEGIQGWIDDKTPQLNAENRKQIISDLSGVWTESRAAAIPAAEWRLVDIEWRFLCLAKARGDTTTVSEIQQQLQQWQETLPEGGASRRWIREALTTAGPAPTRIIKITYIDPQKGRNR